jgi:hypothetical protein
LRGSLDADVPSCVPLEEPKILEVMGGQLVARVRLLLHGSRQAADFLTVDDARRGQSGRAECRDVPERLDGPVEAFADDVHVDLSSVRVPVPRAIGGS